MDANGRRIDPEALMGETTKATDSLKANALLVADCCREVAKKLRAVAEEMEARADEIANTSVSVFEQLSNEALARANQGTDLLKDLHRHIDALNAPIDLKAVSIGDDGVAKEVTRRGEKSLDAAMFKDLENALSPRR